MNSITSSNPAAITRQQVAENQRVNITAELFGAYFPIRLEPYIFAMTSKLSDGYSGGYWHFYTLSNGAFYMSPESDGRFQAVSENGHECFMSADALGITACLYAYSHLSFGEDAFSETCANQYHLLRDYMLDHQEARSILGAID